MKLTLIIHSLGSGGAERVISIIANYWSARGWQITLLTFVDETKVPFYQLNPQVKYLPLGIAKNSANTLEAISNNWELVQKLRKAIVETNPDVAISFMSITNVTTLLATRGLNIPVIVSQRNDPSQFPKSKIWLRLRNLSYRFADRIVVQTGRAFDYFRPQLEDKMTIIPNPVILQTASDSLSQEARTQTSIVAMGRLESQKGFDILLDAFAQLKDNYPEWNLTILGEGSLRQELVSQRARLGLKDRVHLPGRVKDPAKLLRQADMFVMSSRFEGFPNALCEAMACGLPVISTDCPSGPREIIRDGIDGILVTNQDTSQLRDAMESLMLDASKRQTLGKKALEIADRFNLESIMYKWEKAIASLNK